MTKDDAVYSGIRKELEQDLPQLENGQAEVLDIDQLDQELENTLKQYEA